MSYIEFKEVRKSDSGKTMVWHVVNTRGSFLGQISWLPGWRCYVFGPAEFSEFSDGCLREIAEFCRVQTKAHQGRLEAARGGTR